MIKIKSLAFNALENVSKNKYIFFKAALDKYAK